MTDLVDLRRRAAQQSKHGNYWAGKCLVLLDRIAELEAEADIDFANLVITPAPPKKVTRYRLVPMADEGEPA